MSLNTLPNELFLQVESYIETQADLAAFIRTNPRTYKWLAPCLYRRDATAALLYGVHNNRYSTACKALQAGADRNVKSRDKERPTSLMQAIMKNNERMMQLLRDAGANPRIMTRLWATPAMFLEAPTREARQELIDKHYGFGVRLAGIGRWDRHHIEVS
ncbi:hypothetical protein BO86DRAFT_395713 [Aspergillus japonicus CBS 114.51]|uniref:Ankyrin n=1 Tax=Aspergillus japonicus CBS 114.51 TaxID=1448312 RepID=A0A8T8XDP9_ASPJA|nr:hypothetical protein BO86DRAFT_395713 [Aspergillus japonicus CBS 114.51]RAH86275.1 hypothetical protein BO86DRAFT_395713 [Aspergillus japonicus CBS 114.51]